MPLSKNAHFADCLPNSIILYWLYRRLATAHPLFIKKQCPKIVAIWLWNAKMGCENSWNGRYSASQTFNWCLEKKILHITFLDYCQNTREPEKVKFLQKIKFPCHTQAVVDVLSPIYIGNERKNIHSEFSHQDLFVQLQGKSSIAELYHSPPN